MSHENQELIAEDDNKRSEFIYKFISSKNDFNSSKELEIPKIIVQYWHCHDELPSDVLKCIESWKILKEKGFEFKLFDDASAKTFISENFTEEYLLSYLKCHHPAMRCDYFRLCYLFMCGGFYVDCDELYSTHEIDLLYLNNSIKIQPLCYNIEQDKMVDIEDYLEKPYNKNNIYYFNNNPIVAPPKHELLYIALKRATNRLTNEENLFDIQSTTGPGNLTASVVCYLLKRESRVNIIKNWNEISDSPWPLSYRNDDRNWRLYNGKTKKWFS
jgi:mannosyltransferase OCH1-like enzyme